MYVISRIVCIYMDTVFQESFPSDFEWENNNKMIYFLRKQVEIYVFSSVCCSRYPISSEGCGQNTCQLAPPTILLKLSLSLSLSNDSSHNPPHISQRLKFRLQTCFSLRWGCLVCAPSPSAFNLTSMRGTILAKFLHLLRLATKKGIEFKI